MILKHNIKKLTSEEIGFINQEFKHWDELQHRDWVTERIAEKSDSYTNKYMEHFQFLIDQEPKKILLIFKRFQNLLEWMVNYLQLPGRLSINFGSSTILIYKH